MYAGSYCEALAKTAAMVFRFEDEALKQKPFQTGTAAALVHA
jgi:hypothetical protein